MKEIGNQTSEMEEGLSVMKMEIFSLGPLKGAKRMVKVTIHGKDLEKFTTENG